jgi:transposase
LRGQRFNLGVGGGRKRFNILGAYCPQNQEYIDVRQAGGTISYTHVVELLEKLQKKHPDVTVFVLHLDNARYQHARKLKEWIAAKQQTEGITFVLEHVPPYSPNLNLIERLWKFLRKHALRTWHDTFEAMQMAIAKVLDNLADYADELQSLMTEKFHIRPVADCK